MRFGYFVLVLVLLLGCESSTRVIATETPIPCPGPSTLMLTANKGASLRAFARTRRGWGVFFRDDEFLEFAQISPEITIEEGPLRVGMEADFQSLEAGEDGDGFFLSFGRIVAERTQPMYGYFRPGDGMLSSEQVTLDQGVNLPQLATLRVGRTAPPISIVRTGGEHILSELRPDGPELRLVRESSQRVMDFQRYDGRLWLLHSRNGAFGVSRFALVGDEVVFDGEAAEPVLAEFAALSTSEQGVGWWTVTGTLVTPRNIEGTPLDPTAVELPEAPRAFDADLGSDGHAAFAVTDSVGLRVYLAGEPPVEIPMMDGLRTIQVGSYATGAVVAASLVSPFRATLFRVCRESAREP
ncbi:MAG: hypothetical protein AAGF12_02455 [Myxococcota bacterium]